MIIDGKKLQSDVKERLINKINNISDKLKLVVIQVGDDPASSVYVRHKGKLCNDVGILFEHVKYDDSILEKELISKIDELNNDSSVTGILVQLPLPSSINEDRVLESIKYYKDVDGLTSDNIGNLFVTLVMEQYSRGWRGAPAKGVGRVTGARVRISPAPPCIYY